MHERFSREMKFLKAYLTYVRTSLTNSLNPKSSLIWRVNPQNVAPIDSKLLFISKKLFANEQ